MPRRIRNILVDSGFWFALYDGRDQYHQQALEKSRLLDSVTVLLPWPCLYETINTRFCKQRKAVAEFEAFLSRPGVVLLEDEPYRENALEAVFVNGRTGRRPLALVDMVLRLILEDPNVRKHGILTFNPGDFADLCGKHSIELL